MRIRYKPWARKELEESKFYREHPEEIIGNWKNEYTRPDQPLFVELGSEKVDLYHKKHFYIQKITIWQLI